MKNNFYLDHIALKNKLAEQGIKQWWLAEEIGVDKKTIIRWVNGQVKSIQIENAEKLAAILKCDLEELKSNSKTNILATNEDQKKAAKDLLKSSLFEKLGNIGEWNVIESLLRATTISNLPLNVLGELYDKLTIASWRQSKLNQAEEFNKKTKDIAIKTNDKTLLAYALLSEATLFSWRGKTQKSINSFLECISFEKYLEKEKLAAAFSNLGAVYYESGNLDDGEKYIQRAITIYEEFGKPVNLSIAYCHLGIINIERENITKSRDEIIKSIHFAAIDDYKRGIAQGHLLFAILEAMNGNKGKCLEEIKIGQEEFRKLKIDEPLNYEHIGKALRIIGDYENAKIYFEKGINIADEFPIYKAQLLFEYAKLLKNTDANRSLEKTKKASEIYKECECTLRVKQLEEYCKEMYIEYYQ